MVYISSLHNFAVNSSFDDDDDDDDDSGRIMKR